MNAKEKEKKLKILLPVLLIGAALVWMPNLKSTKEAGAPEKINQDQLLEAKKMLIYASTKMPQKKLAKSKFDGWGRNPFIVEGWKPVQDANIVQSEEITETLIELTLSGIIYNETRPSAIINDTVVGLGMKIDQYEVKAITPLKVILSNGVNQRELTVTE